MSRSAPTRDVWVPLPQHDQEGIHSELEAILLSPQFCNSKRYPAFLRYVVLKTLAGEADSLKERTIGVEVFERSPSYDTNSDTVVRYTAGEVRKRLALYYHELAEKPAIQISLPAGSYVPEFLHTAQQIHDAKLAAGVARWEPDHSGPDHTHGAAGFATAELPVQVAATPAESRHGWPKVRVAAGIVCVLLLLGGAGWKLRAGHPPAPLEQFWSPVVHDAASVPVCLGGSVFSQTNISGVATATKDIEYPFVSMQSTSAVAQISTLLAQRGVTTVHVEAAATTPLNDLREHPVILLGGYNNRWTLRLMESLRFHFASPEQGEKIVDRDHPGVVWQRDAAQPYSSADDYALVARFRDPTTDGWVVALAGIGRNGTEVAAQFATSPHYMAALKDAAGTDIANRNVEAVLKVQVIEGKTGAPAIVAVHVW